MNFEGRRGRENFSNKIKAITDNGTNRYIDETLELPIRDNDVEEGENVKFSIKLRVILAALHSSQHSTLTCILVLVIVSRHVRNLRQIETLTFEARIFSAFLS